MDEGRGKPKDSLDVPLKDCELDAELRLTVDLIIAANASDELLGQDEIDRILDVWP